MLSRLLVIALLATAAGCRPSNAESTNETAEPTPAVEGTEDEASSGSGDTLAEGDEPTSMPSDENPAGAHDHDGHGHDHEGHNHDGHDHGAGAPADGVGGTPPDMGRGTTRHYGAPFASDDSPIPLVVALSSCADTGTTCKVTATVERVCQARGCWFTLTAPDVEPTVRVRMADYGFFVPRDAVGANATFEGTLERTQISQEQAQHYADDEAAAGTAPPRTVTGPEDTYQFMITGVELSQR